MLCVPLLWREPALLMLPHSGTSTKEEVYGRNRCGCRNLFKETVSAEIMPRKVRKLSCVKEAMTLRGRSDIAWFWRMST